MLFRDRSDAGKQLAVRLVEYAGRTDVLVLGLPRGGVPVAAEIATQLKAPLDVFLVRKIGLPGQPEYAIGAIAQGGVEVRDDAVIRELGLSGALVDQVAARERLELDRRDRLYRGGRPVPTVAGRSVIVVDDGLATGWTMEAAVAALRQLKPARIVVAVPVGAPDACERLAAKADQVVCLSTPESFRAVGQWYADFSETSDDEVTRLTR